MGDVLLPVPSSGVMLAHGALFGIVVGAALSLLGSLGAFALGFALGRRGAQAVERLVSELRAATPDLSSRPDRAGQRSILRLQRRVAPVSLRILFPSPVIVISLICSPSSTFRKRFYPM